MDNSPEFHRLFFLLLIGITYKISHKQTLNICLKRFRVYITTFDAAKVRPVSRIVTV